MKPEDFGITRYKYKNGKLNVHQDVYLGNRGFTEIPFEFGEVLGSFNVSENKLTSLKNCPSYVSGNFDAANNLLTQIDYLPKLGDSAIFLDKNRLESFEGLDKIFGDITKTVCALYFSNNPLKSLKYFPLTTRDFHLSIENCGLKNLDGLKLDSGNSLNASNNHIASLIGIKTKSFKMLNLSENEIENFDGFPLTVKKELDMSNNYIKSLKGLPFIYDSLIVNENLLESIDFTSEWKKQSSGIFKMSFTGNPLLDISGLDCFNSNRIQGYELLKAQVEKKVKQNYIKKNLL